MIGHSVGYSGGDPGVIARCTSHAMYCDGIQHTGIYSSQKQYGVSRVTAAMAGRAIPGGSDAPIEWCADD